MKREPIKTPFLSKSKESDYHESLAIFKLILRFMNDTNLSGRKEKVIICFLNSFETLTKENSMHNLFTIFVQGLPLCITKFSINNEHVLKVHTQIPCFVLKLYSLRNAESISYVEKEIFSGYPYIYNKRKKK